MDYSAIIFTIILNRMGLSAGPPAFTTDQGFSVCPVYLSIGNYRFTTLSGGMFQCVFQVNAYKSREDKHEGRSPLSLPPALQNAEAFVYWKDFYLKSFFQIGYDAAKVVWQQAGFEVHDVYEPGQPGGSQYTYDCSGFNIDGYNCAGYDQNGIDREGFDREGYNSAGYDRNGFDRNGYDAQGYDMYGFNAQGYDREGYDNQGYNAQGLDRDGNPRPSS